MEWFLKPLPCSIRLGDVNSEIEELRLPTGDAGKVAELRMDQQMLRNCQVRNNKKKVPVHTPDDFTLRTLLIYRLLTLIYIYFQILRHSLWVLVTPSMYFVVTPSFHQHLIWEILSHLLYFPLNSIYFTLKLATKTRFFISSLKIGLFRWVMVKTLK